MMSTTVKATYENGVFKPKEPVSLDEHAEVEVVIPSRPVRDPDDPKDPTSRIIGYKAELTAILTAAGIGAQATPD